VANIPVGTRNEEKLVVTSDVAIDFMGVEGARVLSTPNMILGLEKTARNLLIRHYCLSQSQMSEDAKVRPASAVDLEVHAAEKKPRLDGDQAVGNANTLDKKSRTRKTKRKQKFLQPEAGSMEDVLFHEVTSLLGRDVVDEAMRSGTERQSPFEYMEIVELTISSLSSSGTFFSLHPILADALEDGGSTRWFSFQRCLVKLQGSELSAT